MFFKILNIFKYFNVIFNAYFSNHQTFKFFFILNNLVKKKQILFEWIKLFYNILI